MARRFTLALGATFVLAALSFAQARGGFGRHAHFAPGFEGNRSFFGHHRFNYPRGYYLGDLAFYYDDYPFEARASDAAPQVIVMQPQAVTETSPQPKAAPLLIELEGDRYVRYGGAGASSDRNPSGSPGIRRAAPTPDPSQLAPTVLMYRDGHREEIPDYAIVGRILYAHQSDDDQPGYGMRNIQLSALDLPATMKANRENGVNFILPAGPNEVVTRP